MQEEDLFSLESLVRQRMEEKNMPESDGKMSKKSETPSAEAVDAAAAAAAAVEQDQLGENVQVRRDSFQYQSRLAPKKLLCLKV